MLIAMFLAVWSVIVALAAIVAYAGRTGPEDFIKNFSRWLEMIGVANPQVWLAQWGSRRLRIVGVVFAASLLFMGSFTAGMLTEEKLTEGRSAQIGRSANQWEPLSDGETIALRSELRKLPPEKLSVLCAVPACADLADSIFQISYSMGWLGNYESSYLTDHGIQQGIEIWSHPAKAVARDAIVAALERGTNGRLKIAAHTWPEFPAPEHANDINLVIGRLK